MMFMTGDGTKDLTAVASVVALANAVGKSNQSAEARNEILRTCMRASEFEPGKFLAAFVEGDSSTLTVWEDNDWWMKPILIHEDWPKVNAAFDEWLLRRNEPDQREIPCAEDRGERIANQLDYYGAEFIGKTPHVHTYWLRAAEAPFFSQHLLLEDVRFLMTKDSSGDYLFTLLAADCPEEN